MQRLLLFIIILFSTTASCSSDTSETNTDRTVVEDYYRSLAKDNDILTSRAGFNEARQAVPSYISIEKVDRDSIWVSNNSLIVLALVIALLLVGIKSNYDRRYLSVLSINRMFIVRLNDGDQSRARVMDQDNLVFAAFYIFLSTVLIYFSTLGNKIDFLGMQDEGLSGFLRIMVAIALGLLGKIVLVSLASNLFGNAKITAFYIRELININLFFAIFLFFSSFLIYLLLGSISSFWLSTAVYGVIVIYLVRLLFLYFKILKLSSFSNLYLFSYFCITEIFPFLIGLKYFMR